MNRLVAIITGAGSGIAAAIVTRLARTHDLTITHPQLDPDMHPVIAQAARLRANVRVITGDLTASSTLDAPAIAVDQACGHGRIVTISSVLTHLGRVDLAGYIAAKSEFEGLVRALARELGPHGVTVNCVRAGSIEVRTEHAVVADHAAMVIRQLDRQCINRRSQTDNVTEAVECPSDRGCITCQCLTADGGWCQA